MVWVYTGVAVGVTFFGFVYYYLFRHYDTMDETARLKKVKDQDAAGYSTEKNVSLAVAEAEAEALEKLH